MRPSRQRFSCIQKATEFNGNYTDFLYIENVSLTPILLQYCNSNTAVSACCKSAFSVYDFLSVIVVISLCRLPLEYTPLPVAARRFNGCQHTSVRLKQSALTIFCVFSMGKCHPLLPMLADVYAFHVAIMQPDA